MRNDPYTAARRAIRKLTGPYFGVPTPKLLAGKVKFPQHLRPSTATAVTLTAARYYVAPIYIDQATTFAGAKTMNSGAGDNGKKVKIAIYSEAAAGGPGALAKSFGEVTLTGASAIRTFASSWAASPGWYYLALSSDTAPAMFGMHPNLQVTAVGYEPNALAAEMLGAFGADLFGAASNVTVFHGDYVDGTYANFPESTSLTPTNSIYANSSGAAMFFPIICLYA